MIKGTISNNIKLPEKGSMQAGLAVAIRRLTMKCLAISKEDRFATGGGKGSAPLADKLTSRSGRLRRSINAKFEDGGQTGIVGTAVNYGAVHEYGASLVAQRKNLKHAPHLVKRKNGEHVMTGTAYGIKYPERSFLRAALKAIEKDIQPEINAAVKKAGF